MLVSNFWRDKRVLITGHTGFKGAWLVMWLHRLGAKVYGVSQLPRTSPSLFTEANLEGLCTNYYCDIRDLERIKNIATEAAPEVLFHLAAQPLVRESYRSPIDTFTTNVIGTANVMEALRGVKSLRAAIMVTTDKVYRNVEWPWPYRESDRLGGHDPYSASKAASELVIDSFIASFFSSTDAAVSSARAGNVVGGGDWSEDRLIPDAIRAWQSGNAVDIRRPNAVRPWQHVLEPLAGYLNLAEKTCVEPSLAGAYNFGPDSVEGSASVCDVVELARLKYGSGRVTYGDGHEGPHEAGLLALDVSKSRQELKFSPKWDLNESISRTINWYVKHHEGIDARDLCAADIEAYENSL